MHVFQIAHHFVFRWINMKPSSVFVFAAAIMFLAATVFAMYEGKSPALQMAYAALFIANTGFSLLD